MTTRTLYRVVAYILPKTVGTYPPPAEKGINAETLRCMVAKVEEYSESHRAHGLLDV